MQVTFFLDTTGEHFARWLENYTNDVPYRDFSTERGRITLQPARAPYSIAGPTDIEMEGFYIKPSTNNDTEVAQPLPRIILFKVVPLAPTRLEVTAKCTQPVIMAYFKELLMAIVERWPEAQEQARVEAATFERTLSEPWREMVKRARLEILTAFSREEQSVKSETIAAPPHQAAVRPTPAFDRTAEGTFSFPGTPEQFVNWLRGNVRPELWKASPGNEAQPDTRRFIPVADYYAMLRRKTDVHIYPFEPPPSLDFPVTLQIKGRVSWADPEHDGAQKHLDLHVLIQFEIICPIPGGIKVRVDCFDSAARYYLDALLARLREDWGKRTEERSEQAALKRELAQHKGNLYKLREQAATYAAGETPLHLLNQIEAEEMGIHRIEEQLRALEDKD